MELEKRCSRNLILFRLRKGPFEGPANAKPPALPEVRDLFKPDIRASPWDFDAAGFPMAVPAVRIPGILTDWKRAKESRDENGCLLVDDP